MTDNRIKQIADYNGMEVILNKLTEEAGELTTAIARSQTTELREDATPEPENRIVNLITQTAQEVLVNAADNIIKPAAERKMIENPLPFILNDLLFIATQKQNERK